MGTFTIQGTLEVAQFWPNGNSDADTAKVSLVGIKNPFRFKPDAGPAKITQVFDAATVKGAQGSVAVVKKGAINVRLQGIDTPELHYKPNYRQLHAESAAAAVANLLAKEGKAQLPCKVVSAVAAPNDVCDMFGRVVGDIVVRLGGKDVNLNEWIAREGWGFPAFYTSMSSAEILRFTQLSEAARKAKKGSWRGYTPKVGPFDPSLRERKPGSAVAPEKGPVCWPKYFRRLAEWSLDGKVGGKTLAAYLAGKSAERFVRTDDFVAHGATSSLQHSLATALDANDRMTLAPKDFVIVEKQSTLYAANGTKITAW